MTVTTLYAVDYHSLGRIVKPSSRSRIWSVPPYVLLTTMMKSSPPLPPCVIFCWTTVTPKYFHLLKVKGTDMSCVWPCKHQGTVFICGNPCKIFWHFASWSEESRAELYTSLETLRSLQTLFWREDLREEPHCWRCEVMLNTRVISSVWSAVAI